MERRKIDLLHEEELAEAVRKFPCLYDKRVLSYKDKRAKANACKKIEETLGMKVIIILTIIVVFVYILTTCPSKLHCHLHWDFLGERFIHRGYPR